MRIVLNDDAFLCILEVPGSSSRAELRLPGCIDTTTYLHIFT